MVAPVGLLEVLVGRVAGGGVGHRSVDPALLPRGHSVPPRRARGVGGVVGRGARVVVASRVGRHVRLGAVGGVGLGAVGRVGLGVGGVVVLLVGLGEGGDGAGLGQRRRRGRRHARLI